MNTQNQATSQAPARYTAFQGFTRIASGTLSEVTRQAKAAYDRDSNSSVLVFDDETAERVVVVLHGTEEAVMRRPALRLPETPAGPGRPRLGVVAREVTLLPRHWDWLNRQPGGASVALRRLVEEARRANVEKDRIRESQEACYRFLSTMGGDLPGFEETARALFAGNRLRFEEMVADWPTDVRDYALRLGNAALGSR